MSQLILDTNRFSLLQQGHPTVLKRVNSHPVRDVSLAVITIQEQVQGWQAAVARARDR